MGAKIFKFFRFFPVLGPQIKMDDSHFNEFFNQKQLIPSNNNDLDKMMQPFNKLLKMPNFPDLEKEMQSMQNIQNMKMTMPDISEMSKNFQNKNGKESNGYSYFHSSVSNFDEKGQKYKKTHTLTTGPDGVKQEKKTLEDRDQKYKEMMLGNHIKNRGIEIEKSRRGGEQADIKTTRKVIGMDENDECEMKKFDEDWGKAVAASSGLLNIGMGGGRAVGDSRRRKVAFD